MIKYGKLSKAEILSVLYNNAKAVGLGMFFFEEGDMSIEQAEKYLKEKTEFSYIKGRALLLDLSDDTQFNEQGYDKINGDNSALKYLREYLNIKNQNNNI